MMELSDQMGPVLFHLTLVLGGIIILGSILHFILKKGGIRPQTPIFMPHLSILGTLPLDAKRRLIVVRFYDHDVLLSLGDRVDIIDKHRWKDGHEG